LAEVPACLQVIHEGTLFGAGLARGPASGLVESVHPQVRPLLANAAGQRARGKRTSTGATTRKKVEEPQIPLLQTVSRKLTAPWLRPAADCRPTEFDG
jgi:hypothetical protein